MDKKNSLLNSTDVYKCILVKKKKKTKEKNTLKWQTKQVPIYFY